MAQRPRWNDLVIGLVALGAVIGLAAAILVFGRVGQLHGRKTDIYVTTDAARGVIRGTEVWLDGQKIGLVKDVRFRNPSVAPSERLVLVLQVLESARERIRKNTRVDIRSGGTLIGDQVVSLTGGTLASAPVAKGDTIHAGNQLDLETTSAEVAEATRQFPGIVENVKLLDAQLHVAQGTIGAFDVDEAGTTQMRRASRAASRLMRHLDDSSGTFSLAFHDEALRARANEAMARVDSVRTLLASDHTSFGRFRRDSTLVLTIRQVRADLDQVRALAMSPNGSLGRIRADTMLVRRVTASLDSLFSAMKKHPLRYGWAMRP